MGQVEDRWWATTMLGERVRRERCGRGLRWRARYRDADGRQRSRSFARKPDAVRSLVLGRVFSWAAEPPDDAAQGRGTAEDDSELVGAGGQAAPLLEACVGAFDDVAALVQLGVVADRPAG